VSTHDFVGEGYKPENAQSAANGQCDAWIAAQSPKIVEDGRKVLSLGQKPEDNIWECVLELSYHSA